MTDDKSTVRAALRQARRVVAADAEQRAARSVALWQQVVTLIGDRLGDQRSPLRIMLFESLPTEPDTSTWMLDAAERGWGVHLPTVDGTALRVMPGDIDPRELDVVVVPGVGYTADGHRIGQGGGHYDRFLLRVRPDCLTIGVCYREQMVGQLPLEPHDLAVSAVATA